MRKGTFDAQFALIESRWRWRDEEAEAMEFYRRRLWAAVESWKADMTDAFVSAVEEAIADKGQYGRPSVDGIIERARAFVGKKPADPASERRYRLRSGMAQFLANGWLDHRSTTGQIMRVLGCSADEARSLFAQFVRRRQCPACQFGIGYLRCLDIQVTDTVNGSEWDHSRKPTSAWYECASCHKTSFGGVVEWGESPEEGDPRPDEIAAFSGPLRWRDLVDEERAAIQSEGP